jgi:hypothetical protein
MSVGGTAAGRARRAGALAGAREALLDGLRAAHEVGLLVDQAHLLVIEFAEQACDVAHTFLL